jgi:hypothetical protein
MRLEAIAIKVQEANDAAIAIISAKRDTAVIVLDAVPLFEVLGEVGNRDTARRIGRRRSDSKRTASTGKLQMPIMRACVDRVLLIHLPRHRVISGMIYSHSSSRQ